MIPFHIQDDSFGSLLFFIYAPKLGKDALEEITLTSQLIA